MWASQDKMTKGGITATKVCSKCGRELPLSAFGSNSATEDGYAKTCAGCMHDTMARSHRGGKPKKLPFVQYVPSENEDYEYKMIIMETKKCKTCGRELPLDQFNTFKSAKDGHSGNCKECEHDIKSKAYAKRKDKKRGPAESADAASVRVHIEEHPYIPQKLPVLPAKPISGPVSDCIDAASLADIPDRVLVDVLRSRGWEVTCKRTVVEEL